MAVVFSDSGILAPHLTRRRSHEFLETEASPWLPPAEDAVSFSKGRGQTRLEFGAGVAETATGFYFQRIEGWNVLHHGALWERFRTEYPKYEFLPTLLETPPHIASLPTRVGFVDNT